MMLLEEMASIFLTPFLLIFVVPKRVDDILEFISDFTVNVEGVGHVCSFSAFDFQNHGNSNYSSPHHTSRAQRSAQGKMEKSFLSFQSSYPSWEPNDQGKQFLLNLRNFREQKLQGQGIRHTYSAPGIWRGSPNFRGNGDRNTVFPRELQHGSPGYHLGSLWLIGEEQKNHPYLLDWYYTSRNHAASSNQARDTPSIPFEAIEQDSWMPSNLSQHKGRYNDDYWRHLYQDRTESHLGASTSTPFFRSSVLQQHDTSDFARPDRSDWWARSGPPGEQPQASFLEPPDFNRFTSDNYDNLSDRSLEEQEHYWSSFRLTRSTYMDDDLEAGADISLHFDDVYSRPPESPIDISRLPDLPVEYRDPRVFEV